MMYIISTMYLHKCPDKDGVRFQKRIHGRVRKNISCYVSRQWYLSM